MPNRRYGCDCLSCGLETISNQDYCAYCGAKIDKSVFYGQIRGAPKPNPVEGEPCLYYEDREVCIGVGMNKCTRHPCIRLSASKVIK